MKNKKILQLCLSPDLGGLELFVAQCYSSFAKNTQTYICVAEGKKLDNYIGSTQKILKLRRSKTALLKNARKLAKYIDTHKIDVIHFHWTKDILLAVLAKIFAKRSVVIVQSRHMTMTRFKDDWYHKWLYRNLHTIHAVTNQVREQLMRFIPQNVRPKISQVYPGVAPKDVDLEELMRLRELYSLREHDFVVGMVGRIEEGKGQELLLEAVAAMELREHIKVLIVGAPMDEEYLKELQSKVKELGLREQVVFSGFTKEVDAHMKLFDVSVLATPHETFGLVVIEAMANKVAVVATNKGGPTEIIEDGVDGLLFERNSENLSEKLSILYSDRTYTKKLAEVGYEKVKRAFDKEQQMQKLYKVVVDED